MNAVRDVCTTNDIIAVTAYPGIAVRLLGSAGETMRLLAYVCRELVVPGEVKGNADRPSELGDASIARMISGFHENIGEGVGLPETFLAEEAQAREDPCFMVWRDLRGDVVSIAGAQKRGGPYATIARVYTIPEARGNGYAAALVAHLARGAMAEGFILMLYASSNQACRKIGFTETGLLEKVKRA